MANNLPMCISPAQFGAGASVNLLVGPNGLDAVSGGSIIADSDGAIVYQQSDVGTGTQRIVPSGAAFTVGLDVRKISAGGSSGNFIWFEDAAAGNMFLLHLRSDGFMEVRRSSTVLATLSSNLIASARKMVEFSWLAHNSTGAYEVRIDGTVEVSDSGVDTIATATSEAVNVRTDHSGSGAKYTRWRSMYITEGFQNYLNPGRAVFLPAASDDGTNDWVRSSGTGTHFSHVSEDPFDSAKYLESNTPANAEHFGFGSIPIPGDPKLVMACSVAQRPAGGTGAITHDIDSGGNIGSGTARTPKDGAYGVVMEPFALDPDGSVAWTRAAVEALISRMIR